MGNKNNATLFILRVSMGWLFFYAGYTKVINPDWSAMGYIKTAKTLPGFFAWLAGPEILPIINFLVQWGLLLLGISLILGIFVRISSILGAFMMFMLYLPILDFPKAGNHSFIVDEHIIYIFVLLVLARFNAGKFWGMENYCQQVFGKK